MLPMRIGVPLAEDVGGLEALAAGLPLELHAASARPAVTRRAPARTRREFRDEDGGSDTGISFEGWGIRTSWTGTRPRRGREPGPGCRPRVRVLT